MRQHIEIIAVVIAAIEALRCGSRTALEVDTSGGTGADQVDASPIGRPAAGNGATLCAFHEGPVASCDAGPGAGPIQACDSVFPRCANVGGNWACCVGDGPYNGPGGSCRFTSGFVGVDCTDNLLHP